jgi:O-antigen ligase
LVVGADQKTANRALAVLAWAGAGYAVYGIGDLLLDPTAWLWREKLYNIDSITATFINRNTAAAYFGSCAVVWLVMLMQSVRLRLPAGPIKWAKLPEQIVSKASGETRTITCFGMFFLCLAAMFMTGSRGGVLLSLFAMVVAFVIFFRRDLPRAISLVLALVGAAIVALILLQFLGGNVQARIDEGGLVEQGRLAAYRSTLRMIADYPWFGTGLGTFRSAFPAYRSGDISIIGVWNAAHSTPLELAAEIGVPLAAIIAIGWTVALVVLFWGTRRSRRETVAPLSALAVSLIAVLHTSIDFSMQVAGYAIVVFALVGMGLSQSFEGVSNLRQHRRRSTDRSDQATSAEDAAVPSEVAALT